ncbi:uncharacterized protein LOC131160124 [Malania oleifera]|uniref:uncharacterized protein LOC131160124 n=1 Tax=Malania oleifera TaxID=397392 RepID=UPI0025AE2DBC|nr:uncharacterized protein LOC131160124 [Malania oleifera]
MASLRQRLLLPILLAVGLFSVAAYARPGLHFHPCNTLLISYSFSIDSQNPNPNLNSKPNSPQFLTIFTHFTQFKPRPSRIFVDRPNFLLPDDEPEIRRPRFFPRSSPSSVVSSLRDRTKDIISVVVALLFGVGCGFLTAATMYLAWSLFSNRFYDLSNSYDDDDDDDQDDDDASPKKMGYLKIPAADAAVAPASEKAAV